MTAAAEASNRVTAESMKPCAGQFFVFERPLRPDGVRGEHARMQLLSADEKGMRFLLAGQPPLEPGLHRLLHREFEAIELALDRLIVPYNEKPIPAGMYYRTTW